MVKHNIGRWQRGIGGKQIQPTYTPGPWVWNGKYFVGADGTEVLCGKKTNILRNRQDRNARLMATAPELLEMLKQVLEDEGDLYFGDMTRLIAKAEGR